MKYLKFESEITLNNISEKTPEEIFLYFSEMYDRLAVPIQIDNANDLTEINKLIGYCTNMKSYLDTLYISLDLKTRELKKAKQKDEADIFMARKTVVKAYCDRLDEISKACSRQASIYFEQQKELNMDKRISNIQYGN